MLSDMGDIGEMLGVGAKNTNHLGSSVAEISLEFLIPLASTSQACPTIPALVPVSQL